MNIYLQIISHCQSAEALKMLSFPEVIQSERTGCSLKIASGGKIGYEDFISVREAIEKLRLNKFNEVEIDYGKSDGGKFPWKIKSMSGVFIPAITGELWFRWADWPVARGTEIRSRRMNAKAAETALSYYKVKDISVFEVAIEIAVPKSKTNEVLEAVS